MLTAFHQLSRADPAVRAFVRKSKAGMMTGREKSRCDDHKPKIEYPS
jgi:hypothetical protein